MDTEDLDELIETSDCDGILTEQGIILTKAGIARLQRKPGSEEEADWGNLIGWHESRDIEKERKT